jgi:DNA polymerase-1
MINIHQELINQKLKTKMLLQVHDELVFDVPKEEVDVVKILVEENMRLALRLDVPVEVQLGTGANWLEAH